MQTWDSQRYARNARFVSELGAPLIDLLAPRAGERILDLGCGDGALTAQLAAAGVEVLGIDASESQIAAARDRGLDVRIGDGEALDFAADFDAVFSNAALHWMTDADTVIDGVWRALKPGGRFVAEMGGAGNVAHIAAALLAGLARRGIDGRQDYPWFFPTPEDYRRRLEGRGFVVETIELFDRPTRLPGEMSDWLETLAAPFVLRVPAADRPAFLEEVAGALAGNLRDGEGVWWADYVRLRFRAGKPAAAPRERQA